MHRLLVFSLLVACYRPNDPACNVACDTSGVCPAGLRCGADRLCKPEGLVGTCSSSDAMPPRDAPVDTFVEGQTCVENKLIKICLDPTAALAPLAIVLPIDTDADADSTVGVQGCTQVQPQKVMGTTPVCVIAASEIMITGTIRVTGSRPLALVARNNLTIAVAGTLDASSTIAAGPGPNANPPFPTDACSFAGPGEDAPNMTNQGGGGGAGGGHGYGGGAAGAGSGGHLGANNSTSSGSLNILRGGCKGGKGGNGGTEQSGEGGDGGGAVFLFATGTLMLDGVINASGAGGGTNGLRSGGSGGGSGGMIGLQAPSIIYGTQSQVFASGGSGASGGDNASPSTPGAEATVQMDPLRTVGPNVGMGMGGAGVSGVGGFGTPATAAGAGGGGGGGGGGVVFINGTLPASGLVRPPPMSL